MSQKGEFKQKDENWGRIPLISKKPKVESREMGHYMNKEDTKFKGYKFKRREEEEKRDVPLLGPIPIKLEKMGIFEPTIELDSLLENDVVDIAQTEDKILNKTTASEESPSNHEEIHMCCGKTFKNERGLMVHRYRCVVGQKSKIEKNKNLRRKHKYVKKSQLNNCEVVNRARGRPMKKGRLKKLESMKSIESSKLSKDRNSIVLHSTHDHNYLSEGIISYIYVPDGESKRNATTDNITSGSGSVKEGSEKSNPKVEDGTDSRVYHPPIFRCKRCQLQTFSHSYLRSHEKSCKEKGYGQLGIDDLPAVIQEIKCTKPIKKGINFYTCGHCRQNCYTLESLRKHLSWHSSRLPSSNQASKVDSVRNSTEWEKNDLPSILKKNSIRTSQPKRKAIRSEFVEDGVESSVNPVSEERSGKSEKSCFRFPAKQRNNLLDKQTRPAAYKKPKLIDPGIEISSESIMARNVIESTTLNNSITEESNGRKNTSILPLPTEQRFDLQDSPLFVSIEQTTASSNLSILVNLNHQNIINSKSPSRRITEESNERRNTPPLSMSTEPKNKLSDVCLINSDTPVYLAPFQDEKEGNHILISAQTQAEDVLQNSLPNSSTLKVRNSSDSTTPDYTILNESNDRIKDLGYNTKNQPRNDISTIGNGAIVEKENSSDPKENLQIQNVNNSSKPTFVSNHSNSFESQENDFQSTDKQHHINQDVVSQRTLESSCVEENTSSILPQPKDKVMNVLAVKSSSRKFSESLKNTSRLSQSGKSTLLVAVRNSEASTLVPKISEKKSGKKKVTKKYIFKESSIEFLNSYLDEEVSTVLPTEKRNTVKRNDESSNVYVEEICTDIILIENSPQPSDPSSKNGEINKMDVVDKDISKDKNLALLQNGLGQFYLVDLNKFVWKKSGEFSATEVDGPPVIDLEAESTTCEIANVTELSSADNIEVVYADVEQNFTKPSISKKKIKKIEVLTNSTELQNPATVYVQSVVEKINSVVVTDHKASQEPKILKASINNNLAKNLNSKISKVKKKNENIGLIEETSSEKSSQVNCLKIVEASSSTNVIDHDDDDIEILYEKVCHLKNIQENKPTLNESCVNEYPTIPIITDVVSQDRSENGVGDAGPSKENVNTEPIVSVNNDLNNVDEIS